MKKLFWNINEIKTLKGKTIIVTGGNSGLGFEDVKFYAGKGATVVLACRNLKKGEMAKEQIISTTPDGDITVMELDLTSLESIKDFADEFKRKYSRLDILMNNAGIMVVPYGKTKDDFESQFGTNHLGHFALTGLLFDYLKKTENSRVITISSMAHTPGRMDFDNLMFENGGYSPFVAYARSKLANLMFTYELQRRTDKHKLTVKSLAAHPGGAKTGLFRHVNKNILTYLFYPFFYLFTQSAYRGALTGIRAALDENAKGGEFYGPLFYMIGPPVKVRSNLRSHNKEISNRLWKVSEELTEVTFDFTSVE